MLDNLKQNDTIALIEIIPTNKFKHFRWEQFPQILSYAESIGILCKWYSIGLKTQTLGETDALYLYEIPEADFENLLNKLKSLNPTYILLNERIIDYQWKTLNQLKNHMHCMSFSRNQPIDSFIYNYKMFNYNREAINDLATQIKPYIAIDGGRICNYRRKIEHNDNFKDIDISSIENKYGCSFCRVSCSLSKHLTSEEVCEIALEQVKSAVYTSPVEMFSNEYIINGVDLWSKIERFFNGINNLKIEGANFIFSIRLDNFIGVYHTLYSILHTLKHRNNRISLSNIGLENFSEDENHRFNKGLSLKQIREGITLLKQLESEFPDNFQFSSYGGFGCILFTPWTTINDLRINVDYFDEFNLDIIGRLNTRLQLLPNLALTALAEKEGLTSLTADDMNSDSGCITQWDQHEIPWRHKDKTVSMVWYIGRRLLPFGDINEDDQDFLIVRDWFARKSGDIQLRNKLFRILLDVVEEKNAEITTLEVLMEIDRRLLDGIAVAPYANDFLFWFKLSQWVTHEVEGNPYQHNQIDKNDFKSCQILFKESYFLKVSIPEFSQLGDCFIYLGVFPGKTIVNSEYFSVGMSTQQGIRSNDKLKLWQFLQKAQSYMESFHKEVMTTNSIQTAITYKEYRYLLHIYFIIKNLKKYQNENLPFMLASIFVDVEKTKITVNLLIHNSSDTINITIEKRNRMVHYINHIGVLGVSHGKGKDIDFNNDWNLINTFCWYVNQRLKHYDI